MQVVDQREIQKRGGKCTYAPSSCVILDMLREAWIEPSSLSIFDATYGEGRFYHAWTRRPKLLVGADIRVLDWVVEPDIFIKKPVWSSWRVLAELNVKPDIYVLDPPFTGWERGHRLRPREHYLPRYALGTPEMILRYGLEAASRLGARYLLVKFKDKLQPEGWELASERYFRMIAAPAVVKRPYTSWLGLFRRTSP